MSNGYKLSYPANEIDKRLGLVDDAILCSSQSLTDVQKEQARNNIGIDLAALEASIENIEQNVGKVTNAILYTEQNLTELQKAQARENIGAGQAEKIEENKWELIDTIDFTESVTGLTLTEEPDGTPYNFSRMYMLLEVKNTTMGGASLFYKYYAPNGRDTNLWGAYLGGMSTARDYHSAFEIYPECGYWRAKAYKWSSSTSELGAVTTDNYQYFAKKSLEASPVVNGIKISFTFPANSKITVWGVRANA